MEITVPINAIPINIAKYVFVASFSEIYDQTPTPTDTIPNIIKKTLVDLFMIICVLVSGYFFIHNKC